MLACGQMNEIRSAVSGGCCFHTPVLAVVERQRAELAEGYCTVNENLAVHINTTDKILLVIEGQAVVAFLGYFELPFNPLPSILPSVAADGVVQQITCT